MSTTTVTRLLQDDAGLDPRIVWSINVILLVGIVGTAIYCFVRQGCLGIYATMGQPAGHRASDEAFRNVVLRRQQELEEQKKRKLETPEQRRERLHVLVSRTRMVRRCYWRSRC